MQNSLLSRDAILLTHIEHYTKQYQEDTAFFQSKIKQAEAKQPASFNAACQAKYEQIEQKMKLAKNSASEENKGDQAKQRENWLDKKEFQDLQMSKGPKLSTMEVKDRVKAILAISIQKYELSTIERNQDSCRKRLEKLNESTLSTKKEKISE